MKIKPDKSRLKPAAKLSDENLPIRDMDSGFIINMLEENMKLRQMPIEKRIKKNTNQKI